MLSHNSIMGRLATYNNLPRLSEQHFRPHKRLPTFSGF
jgi:hypothetical protein